MGSYYLGGDDFETISFLIAGITDRLELTVNQYFQEADWTGTVKYEFYRGDDPWWKPTLVLGVNDIGCADRTRVTLTGFKPLSLPYIGDIRTYGGLFQETESGGNLKGFGGVSRSLATYFDLSVLYDGYEGHAIAGASYQKFRVSVMAYEFKHFGAGVSYSFDF